MEFDVTYAKNKFNTKGKPPIMDTPAVRIRIRKDLDTRFSRRESKSFGDKLAGMNVMWDSDIVSIDGAHYHAWFPKYEGQALNDLINDFRYYASHHGDPVSFSYSWIPEGEPCTSK